MTKYRTETPTPEEYAVIMIGMEIADGLVRSGESPRGCAEKIVKRLTDTGIKLEWADGWEA